MKTSNQKNYLKSIVGILCFLFVSIGYSQTTISGKVTEPNGTPILGANVYLEGTYDGVSSDVEGNFSFETTETGIQTLVISFVSFETYNFQANVSELNNLTV